MEKLVDFDVRSRQAHYLAQTTYKGEPERIFEVGSSAGVLADEKLIRLRRQDIYIFIPVSCGVINIGLRQRRSRW